MTDKTPNLPQELEDARGRQRIYRDIDNERLRQDDQWGSSVNRNLPLTTWSTALGEEFGEVCRAILKGPAWPDSSDYQRHWRTALREELTQLAAVAVAMIEASQAGASWGLEKENAG